MTLLVAGVEVMTNSSRNDRTSASRVAVIVAVIVAEMIEQSASRERFFEAQLVRRRRKIRIESSSRINSSSSDSMSSHGNGPATRQRFYGAN